jgi:hypothetical protein
MAALFAFLHPSTLAGKSFSENLFSPSSCRGWNLMRLPEKRG